MPPENNASYCFACRYNASDLLVKKIVVEISRQMSSCKDLVVEPSRRVSLKGLNRTEDTRDFILVRPLR